VQQPNLGLGQLVVVVSRSNTIRHTHLLGLLSSSDHLAAEPALRTQCKSETKSHAIIGVQTHNPSSSSATDLHLMYMHECCEICLGINMLMWRGKWLSCWYNADQSNWPIAGLTRPYSSSKSNKQLALSHSHEVSSCCFLLIIFLNYDHLLFCIIK
jgi:hypothetical protein